MRKSEFLNTLRRRLNGLPPQELDELLADYSAHFADGEAAGRSEEEVAAALGDPLRLVRELRAEHGFRRWESQRTPTNFFAVLFAFLALMAVDFVLLLPVLLGFLMFTLIAGLVAVALCIGGLAAILDEFGPGFFSIGTVQQILAGIAMLGFGIGGGALLIWLADGVVRLLAGYARVHYTLLDPDGAPV
jgi:uncharacterized membrane protein